MAKRSKWLIAGSIIGAAVILFALVIGVTTNLFRGPEASPEPSSSTSPVSGATGAGPSPSASASSGGDGQGSAPVEGWVEEPATSDPEEYATAAIRAVTTFDPAKSSRDKWVSYLESWMTPALENNGEANQQVTDMNKRVLRSDVAMDADQWDYIASVRGTVEGQFEQLESLGGRAEYQEYIFLADVQQTVRPGDGQTDAWAEARQVSVYIECSDRVELTGSQKPGDCKVIRWADQTPEGE